MKALLLLLVLLVGATSFAKEAPIDLNKIPVPTGPEISASEFGAKIKEVFAGGSYSLIPRQLPTENDLQALLAFVRDYLASYYPGNKVFGLLGLLAVTQWRKATILLYNYRGNFEVAVLTPSGWVRIIEDPETLELKVTQLPTFGGRPVLVLGF